MQSFVGSKLLLTRGDCLLTLLRDDVDHIPFPAHWDLPGGGPEGDETPIACALREVFEEFGLILATSRLTAHRFGADRPSWLFAGQLTQADIDGIRFGDEGQEWRLMPVAEYVAHPRAVPHFRQRVRTVMGLDARA